MPKHVGGGVAMNVGMVSSMSPTRWALQARIEWAPVLTFARRSIDFLDWAESNLDIAAALPGSGGSVAGIAVKSELQRLTVHASGVSVELRGPAADYGAVSDAVSKVLDLMSDDGGDLTGVEVVGFAPLEGSYDTCRLALTSQSVEAPPDVKPIDVAVLWDCRLDWSIAQFEHGVVERSELQDRLSQPEKSRSSSVSSMDFATPPRGTDLPAVALFMSGAFRPFAGEPVTSGPDLAKRIQQADSDWLMVATSVADGVIGRVS